MRTVCLCMMVKNESRVIRRALDSVIHHIDAWFICDTGSDDGTPEIARRHLAAIPGQLHRTAFIDFGASRTETITRARDFCLERGIDYLLLLDADEMVEIKDPEWKSRLDDRPHMLLYDDPLSYRIKALVPALTRWHYMGRTHEYLQAIDPCPDAAQFDGIVLHDCGDGGSKSDKFVRDVRLLEMSLRENPDDVRSWFYLGESHLNGRLDIWRALDCYTRRSRMGGFEEEAWFASYRRGTCLTLLPAPVGGTWPAIVAWFEAWERRPWRAEPLHQIVQLCCAQGLHLLGAIVGSYAIDSVMPRAERVDDILFIDRFRNGPGLLDWTSIAEHAVGDGARAVKLAEIALSDPTMQSDSARIRANIALFRDEPARVDMKQATANVVKAVKILREHQLNHACMMVADGLAGRPHFAALEQGSRQGPWQTDFDRSIAAFYVPGRRSDAAQLTSALSRRSGLPDAVRWATLRNRRFHVDALEGHGLRSTRIELDPSVIAPGYHPTNPSLTRHAGVTRVVVRTVNYQLQPDGQYSTPGFIHTRNLIGELQPDGRVSASCELTVDCSVPADTGPVRGFEDMRLIANPTRPDRLWALANHSHPLGNGRRAMFLLGIDPATARICSAVHLQGIQDRKHQKNWMPVVIKDELLLVHKCHPTTIVRPDTASGRCEVVRIARSAIWMGDLRGGTQLVSIGDDSRVSKLALVHGVLNDSPREYFHTWAVFDSNLMISALSEPFVLRSRQIEFAAGLSFDGSELTLTWGENDREAWMGTISLTNVLALCCPTPHTAVYPPSTR